VPPTRIWALTASQYANTLRALVPSAPDHTSKLEGTAPQRRDNNRADARDFSQPHFDNMLEIASDVARLAVANPGGLHDCAARAVTRACAEQILSGFLPRAMRRPAHPEDIERYLSFFDQAGGEGAGIQALTSLLRLVLLSPEVVFRTELGAPGVRDGTTALSAFERASAISYMLSDGPPDQALWRAAEEDRLRTRSQIEPHVRRLLSKADGGRGLMRFFAQYLDTQTVVGTNKDSAKFPAFDAQLARDMAEETQRFVEEVLWRDDGRLQTIFGATYSVVTPKLAAVYGGKGTGTGFARVSLPAGERFGVLTQASFLAAEAKADESDAIARGKHIREKLLCGHIPPPPPGVVVKFRPRAESETMRDYLEQHSADPTCQACHRLMDPIGLALENYDAIGAFRARDRGRPISAAGQVVAESPGTPPISWQTVGELSAILADAPIARDCFTKRLVTYATGDDDVGATTCRQRRIREVLDSSQGNVLDAVVDLVSDEAFFLRGHETSTAARP
jgi:hypothetical protein